MIQQVKQFLSRFSRLLRWMILGGTLFFVTSAIRYHWQDVAALRIDGAGLGLVAIAFLVTLLAHIWSGWVWTWILWDLNQPATSRWGTFLFLRTNIAKYLPGNVWHFYGRIVASKEAGFSAGAATLSVLMESLLMAASALAIALATSPQVNPLLQGIALIGVLIGVHPRVLNPLMQLAGRLKGKVAQTDGSDRVWLNRYPLLPFLGEIGFVALRNVGFLFMVAALHPLTLANVPTLMSSFSIAWVLGLVIPGAPGGVGVFETVAIASLTGHFSPAVILGSVALYRLLSTLAECAGAVIGWLGQRYSPPLSKNRRFPIEKP